MTGFEGLTIAHFAGDREAAQRYVAALGRASYFRFMKPWLALEILWPYREKFPHLFERENDGQITGIAWQSRRLKAKSRRRGKQLREQGYICER